MTVSVMTVGVVVVLVFEGDGLQQAAVEGGGDLRRRHPDRHVVGDQHRTVVYAREPAPTTEQA